MQQQGLNSLSTKAFSLMERTSLYDQNPYISHQDISSGHNGRIQGYQANDKITEKHLPLSVGNEEIRIMLEENGVQLVSSIMYSQIRDSDGHLTRFKSGDHFLYVKPLNAPLPRKEKIGNFPCFIIHNGQDINCIYCLWRERPQSWRSYLHSKTKIQLADPSIQKLCTPIIESFPLSTQYICEMFHSAEHLWFMATEFGKAQLVEDIHNANHAGPAKRLSTTPKS